MTINYVGTRQFDDRLAEFSYTDAEETRFLKIIEYMKKQGWDIDTGVENWAAIKVLDKNEYDCVLADWKKAKKLIKV